MSTLALLLVTEITLSKSSFSVSIRDPVAFRMSKLEISGSRCITYIIHQRSSSGVDCPDLDLVLILPSMIFEYHTTRLAFYVTSRSISNFLTSTFGALVRVWVFGRHGTFALVIVSAVEGVMLSVISFVTALCLEITRTLGSSMLLCLREISEVGCSDHYIEFWPKSVDDDQGCYYHWCI